MLLPISMLSSSLTLMPFRGVLTMIPGNGQIFILMDVIVGKKVRLKESV